MTYRSLAKETIKVLEVLLKQNDLPIRIRQIASLINKTSTKNKIIAIFGNGGSV